MITGSAPIAPSLLEFFSAIGWTVYEAYGISENTVPMAANRPGSVRFGSVGKPFSQNKLRFAKDGEILVKGEGLFDGYWNGSDDRNRMTEDGYYRTGDLGRLDGDGFLYLKGRKSEIIKTSTGRKIAPGKIEAAYAQSAYLNRVTVVGNGQKHLAALCTLNLPMIEKWLREHQLDWPLVESHLAGREEVKRWLGKEYDRFGQSLSPHERVVEFAILPQQLSIEKGELTPSLKVCRNAVESNYIQEINRLYEGVSEKNRYQQEATRT